MQIQVLVDNINSWIIPYALELVHDLIETGHEAKLIHDHEEVVHGEILCLLSCEKIFRGLNRNRHNLIVHESYLPRGKGWSPVTWQILEGKNEIPVTLLEATDTVDAGVIYGQTLMKLEGHELLPEIKHLQGQITKDLILDFVRKYPKNSFLPQAGESTYYKRRKPEDSILELDKTIAEQFNLLRVCDNERYPAFFIKDGFKYIVKIEKDILINI